MRRHLAVWNFSGIVKFVTPDIQYCVGSASNLRKEKPRTRRRGFFFTRDARWTSSPCLRWSKLQN